MSELIHLLWPATLETLEMVFVSAAISGVLGTLLGVFLVVTEKNGILPAPALHKVLGATTNVGRSIPFIILLVAIIPFTRWIVGSAVGTTAAMVPLIVGAIPYVGRQIEATLREVDMGVVEAALIMGATPMQIVRKVYLPEATPGIIRAMTVVTITLVSYSAMAGAVGGGGLGDLAIRYGYQGFRVDVMLSTVLILVLMIQVMQWAGDTLAHAYQHNLTLSGSSSRSRSYSIYMLVSAAVLMALALGAREYLAHRHALLHRPLRIGTLPIPHAEILEHVRPALEQQGIELQLIPFNDYIQPNLALSAGDLDANFFQHVPFMDRFNRDHGTHVVSVARVHIEPLGLYPGRIRSLAALKQGGGTVAIANDPVNSGRGLLLLQAAGLISLSTGSSINTALSAVVSNPYHLQIVELEAAQLPRSLKDLDAAVVNANYALAANMNPRTDALFLENSDSPYANVLATTPDKAHDPRIRALAKQLESQDTRQFILDRYHGAITPASH